jgi:hypothetical protein
LALAVDVHRLVLVAVEEHIQPEVFVELRHAKRDNADAERSGARTIGW